MKALAPIVGLTRLKWNPQATALWFLMRNSRSMSTHYDVLGIQQDATEEDIKSAYVKLCKKHHPDVSSHQDSGKKFTEIAEAYTVLGDKKSKRIYDRMYFGPTQANMYRGQHVYRSRDTTLNNLRRQNPPGAHYRQVIFSSGEKARKNPYRQASWYMAVTMAGFVGLSTLAILVRKYSPIDRKVHEKHAQEMHQLITTRKGINPTEMTKHEKTVTAEKFRHIKF